MTPDEKHAVSHRGRAFRALADRLAEVGRTVTSPRIRIGRRVGPAGPWSTWPPGTTGSGRWWPGPGAS